MIRFPFAAMLVLFCCSPALLVAEQPSSSEEIKAAITQAVPRLEAGMRGSAKERTCFTCHSQAVPIVALAEVRRRGIAIDEKTFDGQVQHTLAHLERGRQNYVAGRGQGGKVLTAGYALWALEAGEHTPDETTAAVAGFLLEYQKDDTHWKHPGRRPPSSGSEFATTYVALRGLAAFGTEDQQDRIARRREEVAKWALATKPQHNEDRVFQLHALSILGADEPAINSAAKQLLQHQRDDGGWSQTKEMESDAYATATAMVALRTAGNIQADHPAMIEATRFLLTTQQDDGTWHVATRAKGFQTYFESGFPHGKDQFISITASAWSTWALALMLPEISE